MARKTFYVYRWLNHCWYPDRKVRLFNRQLAEWGGTNPHDVIIPPGYENIYLNLASDLFAQPVGIMMYIRDVNQDTLGAMYFEACYLPNHSWQTDSQGVLIQESVAVQFERGVPVGVSALNLIGAADTNAGGANIDDTFLPTGEVKAANP